MYLHRACPHIECLHIVCLHSVPAHSVSAQSMSAHSVSAPHVPARLCLHMACLHALCTSLLCAQGTGRGCRATPLAWQDKTRRSPCGAGMVRLWDLSCRLPASQATQGTLLADGAAGRSELGVSGGFAPCALGSQLSESLSWWEGEATPGALPLTPSCPVFL